MLWRRTYTFNAAAQHGVRPCRWFGDFNPNRLPSEKMKTMLMNPAILH